MGCDIHEMVERKSEYGWVNAGSLELGRSYELFAVLAGVRNGYGITPIAEPRGVPTDACSEFCAWQESWGIDGHSNSWLLLSEMKAYDTSQKIYDPNLICGRDENGKITSTCGYTNGHHEGPVGEREIFGLWGKDEWTRIISDMEKLKKEG